MTESVWLMQQKRRIQGPYTGVLLFRGPTKRWLSFWFPFEATKNGYPQEKDTHTHTHVAKGKVVKIHRYGPWSAPATSSDPAALRRRSGIKSRSLAGDVTSGRKPKGGMPQLVGCPRQNHRVSHGRIKPRKKEHKLIAKYINEETT